VTSVVGAVLENGDVQGYRDDGVVLRTQKLGEADRIITLLTRHNGRVRAVAKGVRRTKSRFGARLEPFTHVDVMVHHGRSLDIITQAEVIRAYGTPLAANYPKYTAGTAMLETAERFTPVEKEPAIRQFLLLIGGLRALGDAIEPEGQAEGDDPADPPAGSEPGGGATAEPGARTGAGLDAGADSGPDAAADSGPDGAADSGPDAAGTNADPGGAGTNPDPGGAGTNPGPGAPAAEPDFLAAGGAAAGEPEPPRDPRMVLDAYFLRSLTFAGYAPALEECARCGVPGKPVTAFALAAGGMVCSDCRPPGSASPARQTVGLMIALLRGDWDQAMRSERRHRVECSGLVAAYLQWHLEHSIRSLRHVERA
jgi:recombinational DNA repair protein (RecF pathway)